MKNQSFTLENINMQFSKNTRKTPDGLSSWLHRSFGKLTCCCLISLTLAHGSQAEIPGLILDLNADRDVTLEDGNFVSLWQNQVAAFPAKDFVKRDQGRKEPGSGRPVLLRQVKELNGHNALDFRKQELVCMHETAFASLATGSGCTWIAVLSVHEQRSGLKNVKSFFGNLRNGGKYDGLWGCFTDDNTLWWGVRNGITFGRFDENNKQVFGPKLELERFYILAGRLAAGTGLVNVEVFVDSPAPFATQEMLISPDAHGSKMAIGQERDVINHPGVESFDGEIARFMIFQRPLSDAELQAQFATLQNTYNVKK